jgi:hypothetical protein
MILNLTIDMSKTTPSYITAPDESVYYKGIYFMKSIVIMIIIASIGILVDLIFELTAWTDIYHDYIGTQIRASGVLNACSSKIPEWAHCRGEWLALNTGFFIRMGSFILMTAAAVVGYLSAKRFKDDLKLTRKNNI